MIKLPRELPNLTSCDIYDNLKARGHALVLLCGLSIIAQVRRFKHRNASWWMSRRTLCPPAQESASPTYRPINAPLVRLPWYVLYEFRCLVSRNHHYYVC